jgi:flavorubredoxin
MKITDGVYWVGVNDTRSKLFEALWSLPKGISYNSYLVLGNDKKALIDTVKEDFFEEYITAIRRLIDPADLDYIVLNHVEPDHAGSLSKILSVAPKASVIGTANGIEFVRHYHRVPFKYMMTSLMKSTRMMLNDISQPSSRLMHPLSIKPSKNSISSTSPSK